jgi:regulator of nonsense transcripts 1
LDLSPLLATSDSNVAVDNIAMGLIKEGVKAVRVGRPDKINRILETITLECLLEKEKEELENRKYEARWKSRSRSNSKSLSPLRQRESSSKSRSKSKSDSDIDCVIGGARRGAKGKGKGKKKKGGKADFELQMRILQDADVLCTTTISSGGDFFSKFAFAGVLVDEAAQATEMAAVVPLILRGSQRLVLVGDQCQLPPTVQSTEAEERGLSLSLYSRMVDSGGITPFLLDTQYRSHPMIAEFSARTFYNGQLRSGITDKDRKPPRGLPWPRDNCPIAFINVDSEESAEGDSKMNPGEAEVVNRIVQDAFYQRELEVTEVGVVTPYLAQVRILKRMLKNIVPEGQDPELLEVASVDNFQGREKDLIVFSAVRSNRTGVVGFLADWRRLNVMLTRARRGIIIIGNARTLKSDEHWAKWLEFYHKISHGRARTPSPEKKHKAAPKNETEEEREERLAKERKDAARKLSMAIRFPGMAMAAAERKDKSRSPSYEAAPMNNAEFLTQGGRTKPRRRTPSPERKPLKVHKEVGIGRKEKANEFTEDAVKQQQQNKAKAKAKAKVKLAIASDDEG